MRQRILGGAFSKPAMRHNFGAAFSIWYSKDRLNHCEHSVLYGAARAVFGSCHADTLKYIIDKPVVILARLFGKQNIFDDKFPSLKGRAISGADLRKLTSRAFIAYNVSSPHEYINIYIGRAAHICIGDIWMCYDPYSMHCKPQVDPLHSGVYHIHPEHHRISGNILFINDVDQYGNTQVY